jgi:hypothetical protein
VEAADSASASHQTVLYFDHVAGDVYISENEGKDWGLVQGIPRRDAAQLIEHPFDNRVVSASVAPARAPAYVSPGLRLNTRY